jgi:hypothetical protein
MEYRAGSVSAAVLMVNGHHVDSAWFQPLWDGLLCFTDHRIQCSGNATSSPPNNTVFAYFGTEPAAFAGEFSQFGAVVARYGTAL